KLIFCLKRNDEYLKMHLPTIDIKRINFTPFQFAEDFTAAYAVTYPLDTVGIQAGLVPPILSSLASECADWQDFREALAQRHKSIKDRNQLAALSAIQPNIDELDYKPENNIPVSSTILFKTMLKKRNLVINLSRLNERAQEFYAEILLRQFYSILKSNWLPDFPVERVVVCIDEAHRLTERSFQKYHSKISEYAREIRDVGAIWTATQNYSDLKDDIRNQFATQFLFKTTSADDLQALRTINPLLNLTASGPLLKYAFIDVQRFEHDKIEAYGYYDRKKPISESPIDDTIAQEVTKLAQTESNAFDKENAIDLTLQELKSKALTTYELAKILKERCKIEIDLSKQKAMEIINELGRMGQITKFRFENEHGENRTVIFLNSDQQTNETPLHKYLVDYAVKVLTQAGTHILNIAESGKSLADIETDTALIEIETGLKRKIDDLRERITSSSKKCIVLVPSSVFLTDPLYRSLSPATVCTMKDLLEHVSKV
ncbi:MAG: hypothetical protein JRN52_05655, partial [Nitrososphaerota archaeon]|nr:hypothetical protein [Nitrososphaerota archaeon]